MKEYNHLNLKMRKEIYRLRQTGMGIRDIAKVIDKDASTVSREIRRNSDDIGYLPDTANAKYQKRRSHRKKKIPESPFLIEYIVEKMRMRWSPEQISGRLRLDKMPFYASPETIYKFIYSDIGKKLLLYHFLRYSQSKRGQLYGRTNRSQNIKDRISIHDRPSVINNRSEIGHFEGDLTFFHGNRSANLTVLSERFSRLTILIKNQSKQTENVINKILDRIKGIPMKSITFDNGSEFSAHTRLRQELNLATYFCDPGSPWQKGTVENSISRLHRYIPKNSNLLDWSDTEIGRLEAKMNNIPRKTLGFLTPFEVFYDMYQRVALHS